jgi:hypothetical protein
MIGKQASGNVLLARGRRFNGIKVFSATMVAMREQLGETVTNWMAAHPECKPVEFVVTQSSDDEFHCVTIVLFYAN